MVRVRVRAVFVDFNINLPRYDMLIGTHGVCGSLQFVYSRPGEEEGCAV
jgi:hypothetical protein